VLSGQLIGHGSLADGKERGHMAHHGGCLSRLVDWAGSFLAWPVVLVL